MSKTNKLTFRLRVAAIFLIAAGYGWAGGHFIPVGSPFVAYLFQGVILLVLLFLSLGFFNQQGLPHAQWALRGLTIFAIL